MLARQFEEHGKVPGRIIRPCKNKETRDVEIYGSTRHPSAYFTHNRSHYQQQAIPNSSLRLTTSRLVVSFMEYAGKDRPSHDTNKEPHRRARSCSSLPLDVLVTNTVCLPFCALRAGHGVQPRILEGQLTFLVGI